MRVKLADLKENQELYASTSEPCTCLRPGVPYRVRFDFDLEPYVECALGRHYLLADGCGYLYNFETAS